MLTRSLERIFNPSRYTGKYIYMYMYIYIYEDILEQIIQANAWIFVVVNISTAAVIC